MAGSKSDYLENKILDYILGLTTYTPPATIYFALCTTGPTDSGIGTEILTSDWSNYARIGLTNNTTNFPNASGGSKSNGVAIDFGTAVIATTNRTLSGVAVMDALTVGNMLYWSDSVAGQIVQNGNPVKFNIGALVFTEG